MRLVSGAALAVAVLTATPAFAADLGGNCCADLEERIAELEATTARKSNHKVTLTVYGQINAGLLRVDQGNNIQNTDVVQNGNDETFVGFAGRAKITNDLSAGYTLELADHQLGLIGSGALGGGSISIRQSNWWIKSETLGQLSVGKLPQATQDFDKISTNNAWVANKPLSFGAAADPYLSGVDLPFDGSYKNGIRYDSPLWEGFMASASWNSSVKTIFGSGDDWDVALRYAGEQMGFKLAGGVGYRHSTDIDVNVLNMISLTLPTGDVDTFLAVASVMHEASGLFLNANYANQRWDHPPLGGGTPFTLQGMQLTGGAQEKWFKSVGTSTPFFEVGRISLQQTGNDRDFDFWGLGFVQSIDAAAMDVYVSFRDYNLSPINQDNALVTTAGARIKF